MCRFLVEGAKGRDEERAQPITSSDAGDLVMKCLCAWSYALACLSDALIQTICVAGLVAPGPRLCVCGAGRKTHPYGRGRVGFRELESCAFTFSVHL